MGIAVFIEGVPVAFTSLPGFDCNEIATPESWGDHETRRTIIDWEESASTLDLQQRRMVGGSFGFRVLDEPAAGYPLRALFDASRRAVAYVATTATALASTIVTTGATLLPTSGLVWIAGEAIEYAGRTSTNLTGCLRGTLQTRTAPQYAGTEIYAGPPSWIGRRARVFAVYKTRNRTGASYAWQQLGRWRLEAAPQYDGEHVWSLSFATLADEIATRKAVVGFEEQPISIIGSAYDDTTNRVTLSLSHDVVLPASSTESGFVLLLRGRYTQPYSGNADVAAVVDFVSWDSVFRALTFSLNPSYTTPHPPEIWFDFDVAGVDWQSVQAGFFWAGTQTALSLLTSRLGDGANGPGDFLPGSEGATPTAGRYRTGFGIGNDEVTSLSFFTRGSPALLAAFSEVAFDDFARQWCLINDRVWLVDAFGVVRTPPLSVDIGTAVATIDAAAVLSGTSPGLSYREDHIAPFVEITAGYDPIQDDFAAKLTLTDHALRRRYTPREDTISLELGMVHIDTGTRQRGGVRIRVPRTISIDEARILARRIQGSSAKGFTVLTVTVDIRTGFPCDLGAIVLLELPWMPDYAGGTLTQREGRVLSRRLDWTKGKADLQVQVLNKLYAIAPAATIASYSAGPPIRIMLSLAADNEGISDLVTPGNAFAVGWEVDIWDVSTSTLYTRQVLAAGVDYIDLDATLPFTLEAGVDYVTISASGATLDDESADGYDGEDFVYCIPDNLLANGDVTRWR
jgi:hypothetical protein